MNIKRHRRHRLLVGIIYFCTMFITKNVAATSSLQWLRSSSNTRHIAFISSLSQRPLSSYKCTCIISNTKYCNNGVHYVPSNRIPNNNKRRRCISSSYMSTSNYEMTVDEQQMKIDALKIVTEGINKFKDSKKSFLIITHYQKLLDYIHPDYVHVMRDGKIVKSGDISLATEIETSGYQNF